MPGLFPSIIDITQHLTPSMLITRHLTPSTLNLCPSDVTNPPHPQENMHFTSDGQHGAGQVSPMLLQMTMRTKRPTVWCMDKRSISLPLTPKGWDA